jgi:flavin-dependent dehydrogenase
MHKLNLRQMLATLAEVHAPAARLLAEGEIMGATKGAPLRCSLRGARWSRPGLLATGEAIGSTYSFSGEGIGKALETGLLAASALLPAQRLAQTSPSADLAVREDYAHRLRELQPRFDIYETASHVNHHPWLADLIVWRARRSPRVMHKLCGVLDETYSPRTFSWGGVARMMFQ